MIKRVIECPACGGRGTIKNPNYIAPIKKPKSDPRKLFASEADVLAIGLAITRYRKFHDYSQKEMAKMLGALGDGKRISIIESKLRGESQYFRMSIKVYNRWKAFLEEGPEE